MLGSWTVLTSWFCTCRQSQGLSWFFLWYPTRARSLEEGCAQAGQPAVSKEESRPELLVLCPECKHWGGGLGLINISFQCVFKSTISRLPRNKLTSAWNRSWNVGAECWLSTHGALACGPIRPWPSWFTRCTCARPTCVPTAWSAQTVASRCWSPQVLQHPTVTWSLVHMNVQDTHVIRLLKVGAKMVSTWVLLPPSTLRSL